MSDKVQPPPPPISAAPPPGGSSPSRSSGAPSGASHPERRRRRRGGRGRSESGEPSRADAPRPEAREGRPESRPDAGDARPAPREGRADGHEAKAEPRESRPEPRHGRPDGRTNKPGPDARPRGEGRDGRPRGERPSGERSFSGGRGAPAPAGERTERRPPSGRPPREDRRPGGRRDQGPPRENRPPRPEGTPASGGDRSHAPRSSPGVRAPSSPAIAAKPAQGPASPPNLASPASEDSPWPTAADWGIDADEAIAPAPPPLAAATAGGTDADADGDEPPPRLIKVSQTEPPPPEVPVTYARIVGVKLRSTGPIREFDSRDDTYAAGDWVLVDGERGAPRLAKVVVGTQRTYALGSLRRVLRKARDSEVSAQDNAARTEVEAYTFCKERLRERRLPMKLVQVEVSAGQKATFFFASEERLDFRDLVRDLAQRFHLRIEMRQIGARDGAKAVGGIGSCGRELCCTTFLPAFQPVSIRMAKDQGMVLNPSKLAGQCGRLKCCLVYEHQTYKELGKGLPKVGKRVITPGGVGRVLDLDILTQRVRVYLEDGGAQSFAASEVRPDKPPQNGPSRETPEPSEPSDSTDVPTELRGLNNEA